MKLLITGGTGFLGKHIIEAANKTSLSSQDVWVPSSTKLNVENPECIWEIGEYGPDIILHMAAKCGGILANKNSPADFIHDNVDMASNIFSAAKMLTKIRKTKGQPPLKIYTLGSVCAYPKFCPTPFKEDDLWNGYPEETNAPYGIAKRVQLMLGQTYRQQYGIGGAHLIPVNMYGEHDHFDLVNSHVIPALIRKFDDAIVANSPTVECWGTGEATREFLYAGDCAEALVKAVINGFDTELPVNLGTGKDISIKELATLIGELSGYRGQIVFTGQVSDGQPKRVLDVSRARRMLGWTAKTDLQAGLTRTIEWFRANKQSIS
jgi:GDP-L-fucose synthase